MIGNTVIAPKRERGIEKRGIEQVSPHKRTHVRIFDNCTLDWNTPEKLPIGWAAIVALALGLGGVLLGATQVYYVGPLARLLHPPSGMDIGFELGLIFAGVAYFYLRRAELAVSNR